MYSDKNNCKPMGALDAFTTRSLFACRYRVATVQKSNFLVPKHAPTLIIAPPTFTGTEFSLVSYRSLMKHWSARTRINILSHEDYYFISRHHLFN
jgi:hypothetical protein